MDFKFIDCYMGSDIVGHPTTTYEIDCVIPTQDFNILVQNLHNWFDHVIPIEASNGQSPQSLLTLIKDNPEVLEHE